MPLSIYYLMTDSFSPAKTTLLFTGILAPSNLKVKYRQGTVVLRRLHQKC